MVGVSSVRSVGIFISFRLGFLEIYEYNGRVRWLEKGLSSQSYPFSISFSEFFVVVASLLVMDQDFRARQAAMYRAGTGAAPAPSFYPRVNSAAAAPPDRGASFHHPASSAPPPSSSAAGLGIKVMIKPEYQITPPQLAPQMPEVPRSKFQFDFEFEKQILAEAEKESQNWSRITAENQQSKMSSASSSSSPLMASTGDPIVDKYVASGLRREAVSLAVLNYGDNPVKVREFVKGYNILREMGFSSKNVAEALAIYDNDTDKAVAHFLNTSQ
ncbi:unnamed protein product [Musa acuminata var. zebrina]